MANPKKNTLPWHTGEKGVNRVRLYADPRNGVLYVEYIGQSGKKKRQCLKHSDLNRGKAAAEDLAKALRLNEGPREAELTLRTLFDMYEKKKTPTKSLEAQGHDRRARALF